MNGAAAAAGNGWVRKNEDDVANDASFTVDAAAAAAAAGRVG